MADSGSEHYEFREVRLTPSVFAEIALRIFGGATVDAKKITPAVSDFHEKRGGAPMIAQNALATRKKALKQLVTSGRAERIGYGRYRFVTPNGALNETEPVVSPEVKPIQEAITADLTIGEGRGVVYAYTFPSYRELALERGERCWPIKVGMSEVGLARVLEQSGTALPEKPHIAVAFRTDSAPLLERAFHATMTFAGLRSEQAPGSEWYLTSPDQLVELYEYFLGISKTLRSNSSH